ncbi:MAG: anti-sigma F factor antagonist [Inconstantimicrobium porci]|uniref:Anti-sigma F factor antagonist n=1 Tax=Inconstantimicrobium porci TaxID=2652291 RepID=A0A7X2MXW4_9CLOT|nr:anti-sigma F factor antagonist [Inconstantimicrobium porci]MDD6771660.1 anti-sigma F factor antagonist [Inconstantimicrobium porci]MDY5912228.1 anti-sigma F factor antagonist [Inconstantimicrobium porci]MSR91106.1 anti-sigma F factor antagonist [Inconstantimicrobium porci]
MYLKFDMKNGILIVTLIGELDHHSAEEARIKIDDMIDREKINKVILDFSSVGFMDSSGIGMVLGRYKKLLVKKGELAAVNLNSSVKRVFELSGMFKVIKNYKDLQEAVSCM